MKDTLAVQWAVGLTGATTRALKPVVVGAAVFATTQGSLDDAPTLHCLDLRDGAERWSAPGEATAMAQIVGASRLNVLWFRNGMGVSAHDPGNGRKLWRRPDACHLRGFFSGSVIAVGLNVRRDGGMLLAGLSSETGATLWERECRHLTWQHGIVGDLLLCSSGPQRAVATLEARSIDDGNIVAGRSRR